MKNCPNCAAPYDVGLNKCPYCGTSYFDLSSIDIQDRKPIFLKFRNGDYVITERCIPVVNSMTMHAETYDYRDRDTCFKVMGGCDVSTDISFISIPDHNGNLFTVTYE